MWNPRFADGSVTLSAAAAVLCAVLAQCLVSSQAQLWSETLSWALLPALFKLAAPPLDAALSKPASARSQDASPDVSPSSLWAVAAGVAIFSFATAESYAVAFLPALTPLLLKAQIRFGPQSRPPKRSNDGLLAPLVNTVWGTGVVALFTTFALAEWDPVGLAASIIAGAALLVVYVAFMPKAATSPQYPPRVDVEEIIVPVSVLVDALLVCALILQTVIFGFTIGSLTSTAASGLVKALSWYFTIRTARQTSWCIAPAILTFSIVATRDPFTQILESDALLHVAASFLVLGQIIQMIPKHARARSALWGLILVSVAPYLADVYAIKMQSSSALSFRDSHQHPVEALVRGAKAQFESLLERQSKTYGAARDEYQRRYGMEPPPGFEGWFEFATFHHSPIIDDFDMIHDAISPILALSGEEIRRVMADAQNTSLSELWLCSFSGHNGKTSCRHPHRYHDRYIQNSFERSLGSLRGRIPDVSFLVNHMDEPRVLIPPPPSEGDDTLDDGEFNMTSFSHRPVWDAVTKHCASQPSRREPKAEDQVETFGMPFVTDRSSDMDLCQHPEYSGMHGLVVGPTTFNLFEGLVPVLTSGTISTMGDILIPSPAYTEESRFRYNEAHDVDWDQKRNNLYWAGSTTGGYASDDRWQKYHRHRFVDLAQHREPRQYQYLERRGGKVGRVWSSFLNSRLFDVVFTRVFQCDAAACRDQRARFRVKGWAGQDRPLGSRLAFDLDGNGISGRFYKLLASRSTPLKQTLMREWHDERLVPWLHYVPVSQGFGELPELVLYLTSTEAGQALAREIAEQGHEWFPRAMRDVDMSIYTYRLMLELARLQDPERPASPDRRGFRRPA